MANEVTYADLVTNGGRTADLLSDVLHTNIYDASSLRALMTQIQDGNDGSSVNRVTTVTAGLALTAATNETTGGGSNSALTTGKYDLTVARYYAKRQVTDLFGVTSANAPINIDTLINEMRMSLDLTLTDLLTALFPSLSTSSATTGVNLSVDTFLDAKYALNSANNAGRLAAVLHATQVNDLEESVRGESGPGVNKADFQAVIGSRPGFGLKYTFANVEVWQSDSVATANTGADRDGAMFASGAWAYKLGDVQRIMAEQLLDQGDVVLSTPEFYIERDRDADNGMTTLYVNAYPAAAEAEDARGRRIITDA